MNLESRFSNRDRGVDVSRRRAAPTVGRLGVEGGEREFAVGAGGEVVEGEVAEGGAVEGFDVEALGGEHAADLVVFAFDEGELGSAGIEEAECGRSAGGFLAFELKGAGGEEGDERGVEVAVDRGAIDFGDLVFGAGEAVDEGGLVGEEEEAAGVLVETADAGDDGVAGAPTLGEEFVDEGAFAFVVRAGESGGLVEQEEEAVGMVGGLAVDEHGGAGEVDLLAGIGGGGTIDGDAAGLDPGAGVAAGAVAEVGEQLVEAAHGGIFDFGFSIIELGFRVADCGFARLDGFSCVLRDDALGVS